MAQAATKTTRKRRSTKKTAPVAALPRERRLRYGQLPAPDPRADLYWGISQPELRGVCDAQLAKLILNSPEFEQVLGPKLDQIDARSRTVRGTSTMGRPARWSARQMETLLVYRRVAGLSTIKRARERLVAKPEHQLLLGFGHSLPSEATITRYKLQHFSANERRDLYRELDRQLRQRVMQLPGFDQEASKLGIDGSRQGTRYTPPIPETDDQGRGIPNTVRNADIPKGQPGAITAPDAGIVGKGGGPKAGQGWQFIGLFSEHGTLLGWDISALNRHELNGAKRVLDDYEREVLPHRGETTLSVCTADSGFASSAFHQQLQNLRIVPNVHQASHKDQSWANVSELDKTWRYFAHPSKHHYRNWGANGHSEISCKCGEGVTERIFSVSEKTGKLTIATRGSCPNCGSIRITAGKWRKSATSGKLVLALDGGADRSIGNSLTFHDPLSHEYGQDRFGWGESVHATLERRFGLLKDRSVMRSKTEVETEFAIAASGISLLLLERARRKELAEAAAEAGERAA